MDGRVARGAESRRTTLRRAAAIASVEGLDGLTIGRLAGELEMSKSGIHANFGTKEDLQLATIAYAEEVVRDLVIRPVPAQAKGMDRLLALLDNWIDYSRGRVFPGGCFFATVTAEFDAREGRVHDAVRDAFTRWSGFMLGLVKEAVDVGDLPSDTDPAQLAFELDALVRAANAASLLTGDDNVYAMARKGILNRLGQGNV